MLTRWEHLCCHIRYYWDEAGRHKNRLRCLVLGHRPKLYFCRVCGASNEGKWTKRRFGRYR